MNFLKDFYINLESLISSLILFDYSKLILLFLAFFIPYLVHIVIINIKLKGKLVKVNVEIKKLNIEASYRTRKKRLFFIYLYVFIFSSFIFISKDNLNIILPVITGLAILTIFSLKEQLNNIFLGLLFKSSFSTTVYEGMNFYFKDIPNEAYEISKINLFKSILKNKRTGKIESIENKDLNSRFIVHKPLSNLDYIQFKYIVPASEFDFEKYASYIEAEMFKYVKDTMVPYDSLRSKIYSIKSHYNTSPHLSPFYEIEFNYKSKDDLEIIVSVTTYNYDHDNYTSDFINLRPDIIVVQK